MNPNEPLKFGFWRDIVPISIAWTIAALLMIAGAVLIVGIFTAPLGILLIAWAGWIAGRSYLKHWSKLYDRRLAGSRDAGR